MYPPSIGSGEFDVKSLTTFLHVCSHAKWALRPEKVQSHGGWPVETVRSARTEVVNPRAHRQDTEGVLYRYHAVSFI